MERHRAREREECGSRDILSKRERSCVDRETYGWLYWHCIQMDSAAPCCSSKVPEYPDIH